MHCLGSPHNSLHLFSYWGEPERAPSLTSSTVALSVCAIRPLGHKGQFGIIFWLESAMRSRCTYIHRLVPIPNGIYTSHFSSHTHCGRAIYQAY